MSSGVISGTPVFGSPERLITFWTHSKNCQKRLLAFVLSVRLCVRPCIRMEHFGSNLTHFHEILYLRIFRISVEKNQVSLKSDRNKRYFTWRPIYIFIIFCSFLLKMKNVSDKSCTENQNTRFVFSNFFF